MKSREEQGEKRGMMVEAEASSPDAFYDREGKKVVSHDGVPHWDQGGKLCFITWRLADSLPKGKLEEFRRYQEAWLSLNPKPWSEAQEREYHDELHDKIDQWLSQGAGECIFQDPATRAIMEDVLHKLDGEWYALEAYVIMPNHIHLLIRLGAPLAETVRRLKGASARALNIHRSTSGKLWQRSFYDTLIRGPRHLGYTLRYIHRNPASIRNHQYSLWFNTTEWRLQSPSIKADDRVAWQKIVDRYSESEYIENKYTETEVSAPKDDGTD